MGVLFDFLSRRVHDRHKGFAETFDFCFIMHRSFLSIL